MSAATSPAILILKTAALGDVLRTTSILPGLAAGGAARVTWLTAPGAVDLVRNHPLVERVVPLDVSDPTAVAACTEELASESWQRVLSFDDEEPLCALASRLEEGGARISGAYLDGEGVRRYTEDVAPWFEMGLLSVHGKEEADRRKVANQLTHPRIFADMLGIEMGEPDLPLAEDQLEWARGRMGAFDGLTIGLNTGAGGRWRMKDLPPDRTVAIARALAESRPEALRFLVLGGPPEAERNAAIVAGISEALGAGAVVDGGTDNALQPFAALVSCCDQLVTSDSLALHVAIARRVPVTCFFAPTSAAEIELYGRGEKVVSTSPDYCSYATDADNSTITTERLCTASVRVIERCGQGRA